MHKIKIGLNQKLVLNQIVTLKILMKLLDTERFTSLFKSRGWQLILFQCVTVKEANHTFQNFYTICV